MHDPDLFDEPEAPKPGWASHVFAYSVIGFIIGLIAYTLFHIFVPIGFWDTIF